MSRAVTALIGIATALFCWPYIVGGGIVGNSGDIYQYAAPFRFFAAKALHSGDLPLWNPSIFAGAPFQASPQSALFYPATLLFYAFNLTPAFNLFTVLHFFLNAAGMFLLARSLRLAHTASLACAVVWAFSFFFLSKPAAGHVIHLSGHSWTPWILLLGLRALSAPAAKHNRLFTAALALALAMQFFSGHVQVWLYASILLYIFALKFFILEKPGRWKKLAAPAAFTACFVCVAAVQLFPTLSFVGQSSRSGQESVISEANAYQFATSYSMRPRDLATLVQPGRFGNPVRQNYEDPEHSSTYFETQALYMGWIPLALSAAGIILLIARKSWFLPGIALAFLMLALGGNGPLYSWIWKALSFQRVPARFYLMVFLCLSLAGAYFWNAVAARRASWIKAALLLLIAVDLYSAGRWFVWTEDPAPRLGRSLAVDWLQARQTFYPARVFTSPGIGNPNKLMFFGLSNVNGYEAVVKKSLLEYFLRTQPGAEITTTGIDATADNAALKLFGARHFVSTAEKPMGPAAFITGKVLISETASPAPPAFAARQCRSLPSRKDVLAALGSETFKPEDEILAGPGPAPAAETSLAAPPATALPKLIKWARRSGDQIDMAWKNAGSHFWIFVSESYDPGWKAWNGEGNELDIFESNGYFQGAFAPEPNGPVERTYWRYSPASFALGAWLTVMAIAALTAAGILAAARIRTTALTRSRVTV